MSHLGRPTSDQDSHYSLAPVAKRLSEIMPVNKVRFATDCIGRSVQKEIHEMNMGDILLLENLRLTYWRGSKKLIGGGDTLEAMKRAGVSEAEVSHVSTRGGPTLRFLAGNEMPRIEVLN